MAENPKFTIGIVQMSCTAKPKENLDKAEAKIKAAAKQGAQVICTQELFTSQYFCQVEETANFDLAESIPGPSTQRLTKLAKQLKVVLVASLFERRTAGIYHNTAVVIDADGTLLGKYRKMHIPDDPLYYEKYYFTPGDLGFRAWQTRYGRIGVLICWDQWYPEAARLTAMQNINVLFYPTAIGWHPKEKATFGAAQADAWETMQRAHAISNGIYVASPNRVGLEKPGKLTGKTAGASAAGTEGIEFFGGSFIADPFGRILAKAGRKEDEILLAEINPKLQEETRRNWPFFRDRRIDAYGDLTKRFGNNRDEEGIPF